MIEDLALQLWPLVLMLLALVGITVYVFLQAPASYKLKFFIVPFALFAAAHSFVYVSNMLGYSVPSQLPNKIVYIQHKTIVNQDGEKLGIEVWVREEQMKTRLYKIPYQKQMEQMLDEARKQSKDGGEVMLTKKEGKLDKEGNNGGVEEESEEYPYKLDLMIPNLMTPKT